MTTADPPLIHTIPGMIGKTQVNKGRLTQCLVVRALIMLLQKVTSVSWAKFL